MSAAFFVAGAVGGLIGYVLGYLSMQEQVVALQQMVEILNRALERYRKP